MTGYETQEGLADCEFQRKLEVGKSKSLPAPRARNTGGISFSGEVPPIPPRDDPKWTKAAKDLKGWWKTLRRAGYDFQNDTPASFLIRINRK